MALIFNVYLKPKIATKPTRRIYKVSKANPTVLKTKVNAFSNKFINSNPNSQTIDASWNSIKTMVLQLIDKHVPYKNTKQKTSLPWVITEIKRNMRKRDRLFLKARTSNANTDWNTYRSFRNSVVKLIKTSNINYIKNVIGKNLHESPNIFGHMLNLK